MNDYAKTRLRITAQQLTLVKKKIEQQQQEIINNSNYQKSWKKVLFK